MRSPVEILADIRAFRPDNSEWLQIDRLVGELWHVGAAASSLNELLFLFERFPDEDNEVLWGVMHGVEGIPGYESEVVRSVQRQPSMFGVLMLGRILNTAKSIVDDTNLVRLLQSTSTRTDCPTPVRKLAQDIAQRYGESG